MSEHAVFTDNNDIDQEGFGRVLDAIFGAGVFETTDWAVTQRAAGANMSVDIAPGKGLVQDDLGFLTFLYSTGIKNLPLAAADATNARKSIIVAYEDKSVTGSTNALNRLKFKEVAGTPAGSPSDPSDIAIQSSVGSGNPWQKLARIGVDANETQILNSPDIVSLRTVLEVTAKKTISNNDVPANEIAASKMQDSGDLELFRDDANLQMVKSGGVWSQVSGLNGTMTALVAYLGNGVLTNVATIASRAFTASKDTYVSVSPAGVITYQEVVNPSPQPALGSGYLWLAKVVCNGSAITGVLDLRRTNPIGSAVIGAVRTASLASTQWSNGTYISGLVTAIRSGSASNGTQQTAMTVNLASLGIPDNAVILQYHFMLYPGSNSGGIGSCPAELLSINRSAGVHTITISGQWGSADATAPNNSNSAVQGFVRYIEE